jgi:competence protein ComEA
MKSVEKTKFIFFLAAFIINLFVYRLGLAIDINTATAEELAKELAYVGPVKAQRIVEYRKKIGGFVSPEQLLEVYGIGPKTLERNREKIVIANNTAQLALLNEAYHTPIDLSPPLAKSPRLVTPSLLWDTLIIIPLVCFCLLIFIKAWRISLKKDKVTATNLDN